MEHPIVINSRGKVEKNDKQGIIAKLLSSQAGRQRLARSMVQPLRTRLDYQSIGRKAFMVEQLPSGALPTYDKDPNDTGFLSAQRVTIPEFEIVSSPTIRITDVAKRRFNLIDRYKTPKTINRSGYKRMTIW